MKEVKHDSVNQIFELKNHGSEKIRLILPVSLVPP